MDSVPWTPLVTAERSVALSTSLASRSPVAGEVPAVPFKTPEASVTEPLASPVITAASLAPRTEERRVGREAPEGGAVVESEGGGGPAERAGRAAADRVMT